jgi:dCMP deaminase
MRPDIDSTLMAVATVWQDRSTCSRNHVGVVIAKSGRAVSTGYNGSPAGLPHCEHNTYHLPLERPTMRVSPVTPIPESGMDRGCHESIHAEANALAYAARHGTSVEGATLYTTLSPCYPCSQLIIAAGLARVVFDRSYRDPAGIDLLRRAGVVVDNMRNIRAK